MKNKREKLLDQLTEAKMLHKNIEKRGFNITNMLQQYFTQSEYEQYTTFMKTKSLLILQTKVLSEQQSSTQQQLDALSLQKF